MPRKTITHPRSRYTQAIPTHRIELYREHAEERGMTLNDWMCQAAAWTYALETGQIPLTVQASAAKPKEE